MTKRKPTEYYSEKIKDQIKALGMSFDHPSYVRAVELFQHLKITQKQHDELILFHAKEVKTLFMANRMPVKYRFYLALHFLGVLGALRSVFAFFEDGLNRIKRLLLGA